eukprot:153662-Prorocentrum_minimum.AAC.4
MYPNRLPADYIFAAAIRCGGFCRGSLSFVYCQVRTPESTHDGQQGAFDFNSTVDSRRRLSTLVYHSAHVISNILSNIRRIFPIDRLPLAGRQSTPGLECCRPSAH